MGRVAGAVLGLGLWLSSFLGSIFILFPALPLLWLAPRRWRLYADRAVGCWLSYPVVRSLPSYLCLSTSSIDCLCQALLEFLHGFPVHVSGDAIARDAPGLILMNHRTRLDWLFFWAALLKMDPRLLASLKISLKKGLKSLPGPGCASSSRAYGLGRLPWGMGIFGGWAMECGAYIFLERDWGKDEALLSEAIAYYARSGEPYQLLLFPEGSDLSPANLAKARAFAEEKGLTPFAHLLQPRTTGFAHILASMKGAGMAGSLYDVTVAFAGPVVQTEAELIKGQAPGALHFHVRSLPLPEAAAAGPWLRALWARKEAALAHFYAQPLGQASLPLAFAQTAGQGEEASPGQVWASDWRGASRLLLIASLWTWSLATLAWIYIVWAFTPVRLYAIAAVVTFWLIQRSAGGLERLAIAWS